VPFVLRVALRSKKRSRLFSRFFYFFLNAYIDLAKENTMKIKDRKQIKTKLENSTQTDYKQVTPQ
jgi:hypothetical protein